MFDNFFKYFWINVTMAVIGGMGLFFSGCTAMTTATKKDITDKVTEARDKVKTIRADICGEQGDAALNQLEFLINAALEKF